MQPEIYKQINGEMIYGISEGLVLSIKNLWYIWFLIFIVVLIRLSFNLYRIYKLNKAGLPEIDKMSGTEFEDFLAQLLKKSGYKVEQVGGIADYGADLIIEKENIRTAVQAKCWKTPITVKAIQEINTAKAHYNATEAMAITNSHFTSNAKTLANENHVQLVDRAKLASLILQNK